MEIVNICLEPWFVKLVGSHYPGRKLDFNYGTHRLLAYPPLHSQTSNEPARKDLAQTNHTIHRIAEQPNFSNRTRYPTPLPTREDLTTQPPTSNAQPPHIQTERQNLDLLKYVSTSPLSNPL
jgi:hypothetical protein